MIVLLALVTKKHSPTETPFSTPLLDGNDKHVKKIAKTVKILSRLATDEKIEEAELPKLLQLMDEILLEDLSIKEYAVKFGFSEGVKRKRKN